VFHFRTLNIKICAVLLTLGHDWSINDIFDAFRLALKVYPLSYQQFRLLISKEADIFFNKLKNTLNPSMHEHIHLL